MSKDKQIEEMARVMANGRFIEPDRNQILLFAGEAEALYNSGYRKQSEGEWTDTGDFQLDNIYSGWKCSLCGHIFCGNKTNFCSNCGAKMRKEDEGK